MGYALPTAPVFQTGTSSGGGGGGTGTDATNYYLPFSYGDASPEPIEIVASGKKILSVRLFIETVFDGSGAALSVGPSSDIDQLMDESENNPAALGEYSVYPGVEYGSATLIELHITPGSGASQGAGLVVLEVEP
jgi:hypothetical protein